MIRLLGLALYGPLAASTRHRLGQYVPGLALEGIDLQVRSLLGDEYLRRRFAGGSLPWLDLVVDAWGRCADLWRGARFDAAMLHCELFPLMPGGLERGLLPKPYIYDFDDAFYLKYRKGRLGFMRWALGGKFDSVIAGASAVTAGNAALADYARALNPATYQFPTVVDTEVHRPLPRERNNRFTVGWIGSPSTAPYLSALVEPLSVLAGEGALRFVVIGGKAPAIPGAEVVELPWSEQTEVALINSLDVGVMPLPDDDWARGKCAFKLIQYMACAIPVVASRVGANVDVVANEAGFLAESVQEWVAALRTLRDSPQDARRMGEAGRLRVEQHYSLKRNLPILAQIIRDMVARGR
ncbi:MAG: glycosyltransferase family 4 protein [Burkholderiales bacterium]